MAVHADHLAPFDFSVEFGERQGESQELAYGVRLLPDMVELEDPDVDLPTVDAGVCPQVGQQALSQPSFSDRLGCSDLVEVEPSSLPEVAAETLPAPMLAPFTGTVERALREDLFAPSAVLTHEHMFVYPPDATRPHGSKRTGRIPRSWVDPYEHQIRTGLVHARR
jgi:hypothetical protein